jgi:hypothetical protein
VQDILFQLQRLVSAISRYNDEAAKDIRALVGLFPVEMDLKEDVFQYKQNPFHRFNSDDRDESELDLGSEVVVTSTGEDDMNIIDLE